MTTLEGIDFANFTPDLPATAISGLEVQGVGFAIPGTQTGLDGKNYTEAQIRTCRADGLLVPSVYAWVYWRHTPAQIAADIAFALSLLPLLSTADEQRAAGIEPLPPIFLDCEDAVPSGMLPEDVVAQIDHYAAACGAVESGIYTGGWWWPGATRNSTKFANKKLWDANYMMKAGAYPPAGAPQDMGGDPGYGGWTHRTVWQFSSEGPYINADHNVIARTIGAIPVTTPPAGIPTEHYPGELNQRRAFVTMLYNLETTTGIRFSDDGSEAIMTDVSTGAEVGRCKILNQPTWAAPN